MNGLEWDDLPDEIKEAISAEAGDRAEAEGIQQLYGEQMHLQELVDKRNKAIIEGNLKAYQELTEEMFGD
jgi:TRAP-type C4-dicarboxylate transport system substrate-binding protein